jgi:hypothetical protein
LIAVAVDIARKGELSITSPINAPTVAVKEDSLVNLRVLNISIPYCHLAYKVILPGKAVRNPGHLPANGRFGLIKAHTLNLHLTSLRIFVPWNVKSAFVVSERMRSPLWESDGAFSLNIVTMPMAFQRLGEIVDGPRSPYQDRWYLPMHLAEKTKELCSE